MGVLPAAIVLVNSDLTENVKAKFVKQLHITDVIDVADGYLSLDGYEQLNPDYADYIRNNRRRLLVIHPLDQFSDRSLVDVVLFFKNGLVSVEFNKYGPPGATFQLLNLYWGQLGIF